MNKGKFTRKQVKAIAGAVASGDMVEGARRAGYANPYVAANQLSKIPDVVAEVRKQQTERMNNDLLPAAVDLLHKVLTDETEQTRNRIAAAKIVLDRTLGANDGVEGKEPHEMTADELANRIATLRARQGELASGAIDITPAGPEQAENEGDVFG